MKIKILILVIVSVGTFLTYDFSMISFIDLNSVISLNSLSRLAIANAECDDGTTYGVFCKNKPSENCGY